MKQLSIIISVLLVMVVFSSSAWADLLNTKGQISLLRVHDVGEQYGHPRDRIDVEVVINLKNQSGAFGFQLRNDNNRLVRQGMLDLLRDAFNHNWIVNIDYEVEPPKINGVIIRVWLTKPRDLAS